jgi:hypothetical protein
MAGNRSRNVAVRARRAVLVGVLAGGVAVAASGAGLAGAAGAVSDPPTLIDPPLPWTSGGVPVAAGTESDPPALIDPPIPMTTGDGSQEPTPDVHEVVAEYVAPLPTSKPLCLASLPTRCSLPIVNTRTIRGDVTGLDQSTGGATIESGRFTSLVGNDVMEITDGPCGAGTFVAQTTMANADMVRQPDGSVRFEGEVEGHIVPGSGTGGYEHASYRLKELGQRPSPGDGTSVLYSVSEVSCGS